MLNKACNMTFKNGYRWNVNVLLGKCFLFWRYYAPTSILPVVSSPHMRRFILNTCKRTHIPLGKTKGLRFAP
jgi:hypothetical protein